MSVKSIVVAFMFWGIISCSVWSQEFYGPVKDVESTEKVLPEFPKFRYHGVILGYENLKYRFHDDICFTSVFPAYKHFDRPLGKYYMYYAAHDGPGICLAYSDNITGPWTEYESNPLFDNVWEPYYKVSHTSSPDVCWISAENKLFIYFHGENWVTRYATSTDGIHFCYGGEALKAGDYGSDTSSYSRVYEYSMPGCSTRYVMFTMGTHNRISPVGTREIFLATSVDGRTWNPNPEPLLPFPPGTDQMGPGGYLNWDNRHFLIMMANLSDGGYNPISNIYLYEVDEKLQNPKLQGVLLDRGVLAPEHERFSSPDILVYDGKIHLFFTIGGRLNEKAGYAVADLNENKK